MIDSPEIVARVLGGFASEPHEQPTTRTTPDGERRIGMLHVPDCPDTGLSSWASLEASAFSTPFRTPDKRPVRVEFVAAIDDRLDRFGDAVAACAFAIGPESGVRPGTVYHDVVSRLYPSASTPHLMSVTPFVWEGAFIPYDDDDAHVTWLQLVPITDREARFVAEYGITALEDAFEHDQPDLYSVERADVRLG
ncbi:suppressor of fused domain protein [Microbacterium sp. MPKO10]|uniref:suppressor of fused domain protein n=1 Tax=Microbacterium sp. MPKO10 TaxID=2989818 RepID=UPI0022367278|nr:suppressor of fused domain protein [Microbacterium sp. MPKO10]MCW4457016.1 suppressor of fused domain protein [Microbacterium sp. MPKO10]